jgi:two-component system sensor kinase FixL
MTGDDKFPGASPSPTLTSRVVGLAQRLANTNGYALAAGAVALALLARLGLEAFGKFYYMPLICAVMLPALLSSRGAVIFAILLSIAANVVLVPRESVMDAVTNALLFATVGIAIGEIGRARRKAASRAKALTSRLTARDATIQAIVSSAPVVAIDADSIVRHISPPACKLFRVSEQDVTGAPFSALVDFCDLDSLRLSAKSGEERHWVGRRGDGDLFPLDIQMAQLDGVAGYTTVLSLADLSLWHAAETRNQELSDQLDTLWRMNSLGEIAAILSHELNQPLTAAATYLQASQADLGKAGALGDSATRTIELAKGQVLRAGAIIRRAREMLSVDARTLQPERVSSMVDDLAPLLQLLGPSASARIILDIDERTDDVLADRIQLQQAIVNLVRNAVEAVGASVQRDVVIRGRPTSDGHFKLSVEDSGPGVAPAEVATLFKPLMTTKANGMGLGLSVTRSIVDRHGAQLEVGRSDMGGAAFSIILRRAAAQGVHA